MLKNNHLTSLCAVILAATALLFTSCVPENVGPDADLPKGAIRLTAPGYTPQNGSKLGVDNVGKDVFFAAGDELWVNGEKCTIEVSNGVAYVRPTTVSYPIRMVYPYDIVDRTHNNYSTDSDNIPIKLPSEYTYATVQNGPGAGRQNVPAPLCAKIKNRNAENAEIDTAFFQHITAAITIAIENKTGAPMELEKIVMKSIASNPRLLTYNGEINITNISINNANSEGNGNPTITLSFGTETCRIENNDRAYIQIPIVGLPNETAKYKLIIGVLAKNMLPGVIANKFYFEKKQNGDGFNITKGQLAYAPAKFDIDENIDATGGLIIDGTYTIGTDANGKPKKVYFSKSNLFFDHDNTANTATTITSMSNVNVANLQDASNRNNWIFSTNQYDYAESNQNVNTMLNTFGRTLNGKQLIALFLYGATGHHINIKSHHPLVTPRGVQLDHYLTPLSRTDSTDWGVRMGDDWFTLSKAEWEHLIARINYDNIKPLYNHKATVESTKGMLFFPDKCGINLTNSGVYVPTYLCGLQNPAPLALGADGGHLATNQSGNQWEALENAGVAFLPAAGKIQTYAQKQGQNYVNRAQVANVNVEGYYWTSTSALNESTSSTNLYPYYIKFSSTDPASSIQVDQKYFTNSNTTDIAKSFSVRLVHPANF